MKVLFPATAAGLPSRRKAMLGLGALLLGQTSHAEGVRPLKLAIIELMPWAVTSADGQQSGIFIDASKLLSKLSGVTLKVVTVPYARALMMLEGGQVDLMFALECDRINDISCRLAQVATEDVVMVGRPGLHIRTMGDLSGKTVGHLRACDYDPQFAAAAEIIKYETSSYSQSLQMMKMGRLDAMISVRTALRFTLKSLSMKPELLGTPLFIRRTPVSLFASKSCANSDAVKYLKHACDVLRNKQTVKALEERLLRN